MKRMRKMVLLILAASAAGGCQLLLPEFSIIDRDAGEDAPYPPEDTSVPDDDDDDIEDGYDFSDISNELSWVQITGGPFVMGYDGGRVTERPEHTVTVSSFEITATEITQAQFMSAAGSNPSYFDECPGCPVEQVNWFDARSFCAAAGGRLPSEAEWEYAARGGTTTLYYCGDDDACLYEIAWWGMNASGTTHPVGGKTPNDFTLYDMSGNVWEWVEDCWHETYDGAPSTGGVWEGGDCTYRPARGCSYGYDDSEQFITAYRTPIKPDSEYGSVGFRCVR